MNFSNYWGKDQHGYSEIGFFMLEFWSYHLALSHTLLSYRDGIEIRKKEGEKNQIRQYGWEIWRYLLSILTPLKYILLIVYFMIMNEVAIYVPFFCKTSKNLTKCTCNLILGGKNKKTERANWHCTKTIDV